MIHYTGDDILDTAISVIEYKRTFLYTYINIYVIFVTNMIHYTGDDILVTAVSLIEMLTK